MLYVLACIGVVSIMAVLCLLICWLMDTYNQHNNEHDQINVRLKDRQFDYEVTSARIGNLVDRVTALEKRKK